VTLASKAYGPDLQKWATDSLRAISAPEPAGSRRRTTAVWRYVFAPGLLGWKSKTIHHKTAIFRQVNKDKMAAHHDALEFPDGRIVLLTLLCEGQAATVLQLPAQPTSAAEAREQERVNFVG
jgi:hypothetical protein